MSAAPEPQSLPVLPELGDYQIRVHAIEARGCPSVAMLPLLVAVWVDVF